MKKLRLGLLTWVALAVWAGSAWSSPKTYDFEFKQMDFTRVVARLARLTGKSAIFSTTVRRDPIDLSLRDVTAAQALKLIVENYGYVMVDRGHVINILTPVERGPVSTPPVILAMRNVLAKDLEPNVKAFVGAQGTVTLNDGLNALVVTGPDDMLAKVRALVEELDQEPPQVFIEAQIVQASKTFSRDLGMEWGPNLGDRAGVPGASLGAPATNDVLHLGTVIGTANGAQLQARLTAGEQNGDVKIISRPKITTLNGMPATIASTQTFNVRTLATTTGPGSGTTTGGGTSTGGSSVVNPSTIVGGLQSITAGITLKVTPYIVSRESVRLLLSITKSDPDNANAIDGIPGIDDNSANTSLVVHTGETASIGGLFQKSDSSSSNGAPFLSSIPILGYLFGDNQKNKQHTELMIFLTPTIFRRHNELHLPPPPPAEAAGKG